LEKRILANKSLTEVLNKQVPMVESWGTFDLTGKDEKNFPSMPTKENPDDK
jgi:hypothetical protein